MSQEKIMVLKAVITQARAVDEKLTSAMVMPEKETSPRIKTETNSTFELGIPDKGDSDSFQISLVYTVKLSLEKTDFTLCNYEGKYAVIFHLTEKVTDWDALSPEAVTPYFSFAHYLARQHVEGTLINAGFRGVALPVPDNIKNPEISRATPAS